MLNLSFTAAAEASLRRAEYSPSPDYVYHCIFNESMISSTNDCRGSQPSEGETVPVENEGPNHSTCTTHRHFKMYKPARVLTQFVFNHKKRKRRQLLGDVASMELPSGTMAIGRLDEDSEGLLLLTTNGKISELVRRKSVEKEYWVQVDGQITFEALKKLQKGVEISLSGRQEMYTTLPCNARSLETTKRELKASGKAKTKSTAGLAQQHTNGSGKKKRKFKGTCNKCGLEGHKTLDCPSNDERPNDRSPVQTTISLPPGIPPPVQAIRDETRHGPTSWVAITITEGKNRQVRKMTAAVGFPTLRLIRVRIGSITLDDIQVGEVRELKDLDCFQVCRS
jgi:pseudouridine synthase